MKSVGIIAEYNPFHSGHAYQIQEAKRRSGADCAVIAMSGALVQRGMPASFPKRFRAVQAVRGGADLVLELPCVYSSQSAEAFASGAVKTLLQSGVDALSFGVETDSLNEMKRVARILAFEPDSYQEALQSALKEGLKYPAARVSALKKVSPETDLSILESPNNILAIEYLKALYREGALGGEKEIEIYPVRRAGSGYHEKGYEKVHASASQIRSSLYEEKAGYEAYLDTTRPEDLKDAFMRFQDDAFLPVLASRVMTLSLEELGLYPGMGSGLKERLRESVRSGEFFRQPTLDALVKSLMSKNLTESSIRRALLNLVMDLSDMQLRPFRAPFYEPYLRVLSMSDAGRKHLRKLKESEVPVVSNPGLDFERLAPLQKTAWEMEDRACAMQALLLSPPGGAAAQDYGPGSQMRLTPVYVTEKERINR